MENALFGQVVTRVVHYGYGPDGATLHREPATARSNVSVQLTQAVGPSTQ